MFKPGDRVVYVAKVSPFAPPIGSRGLVVAYRELGVDRYPVYLDNGGLSWANPSELAPAPTNAPAPAKSTKE